MNLTDTFTYPPSSRLHIPAQYTDKERFEAVDAFYYFAESITSYTDVPTGGYFAVVHSPSPYTIITSPFYNQWTVTVYKVVYRKVPKVDKQATRYYQEVGSRALEANEAAYFEGLRNEH